MTGEERKRKESGKGWMSAGKVTVTAVRDEGEEAAGGLEKMDSLPPKRGWPGVSPNSIEIEIESYS